MRIVVCVKQVPATESKIKPAPDGKDIDRSGLSYVVNPYDEFGIEEALKIKEKFSGEVIALTIAPEKGAEALRTCLAVGADRAVRVWDNALESAWVSNRATAEGDAYSTAVVLAAALKRIGFDLIFCGKQAVDDDNAAVGIHVAEVLGIPHVAVVNKLEVDPAAKKAVAHRQIEGAIEVVETPLPALFTCQKGLNEPRYASLPGIMKAKQKPLEVLTPADLGLTASEVGAKLEVVSIAPPPARTTGRIIDGEPATAVVELVRLLREEAKVL